MENLNNQSWSISYLQYERKYSNLYLLPSKILTGLAVANTLFNYNRMSMRSLCHDSQ